VLRHVDAPTASAVALTNGGELVVLVGGYQSCACPDDGTFNGLRSRLATVPGITVVRFGQDPRFPYDTYGSIDRSAIALRDQIRALTSQYAGVHIVTHSMGGVVADRALANGLSRADGLVTYISWSAPHDGSDAARGIALARTVAGGPDGALREGLLWLRMEPDSPAVRDLARVRASAAPQGIVRLDLREATDVLVTASDARDPGVPSRVLTGAMEGHGGILTDPEALDLTARTIATRRVPPDERSLALRAAAAASSDHFGDAALLAVCVLVAAACLAAVVGRTPMATPYLDALRALLPRAKRQGCP
jgi:hypothetical protein